MTLLKNRWIRVALCALISMTAVGCGGDDEESTPAMEEEQGPATVVAAAASDDQFSTLVTAVTTAKLDGTLSGAGPFTVFAPTNDAFGDLPDGALEGLLDDEAALANVLTFHVVDERLTAADVVGMSSITTLQGSELAVEVDADGNVTVGGAAVTMTDITTGNGVIHVIDTVLLPPAAAE
ncbi:MAG: fasciclin domain-containing protein [Bradymonadia bacterium]